jgi:hypothetical protein
MVVVTMLLASCDDFMDIVPDNVATLDQAFSMRNTTERYLFTLYSMMPRHGANDQNGFMLSDELWGVYPYNTNVAWRIARGEQNVVSPIQDYWNGGNGGRRLFITIRDCNVFLENVVKVPDIEEMELVRWSAEAKFIKAYCLYWIFEKYGPIPIMRENLPIDAGVEEVKVRREPVDDVISYIVDLMDEAIPGLPDVIESEATELGRLTKVAAMAIKARVLVTAASPLFNGNTDYAHFVDYHGNPYFNQEYSEEKWRIAAEAAKEAIDFAHENGHELYYAETGRLGQVKLSDTTIIQLGIRGSITERWNCELLWGDPNNRLAQVVYTPRSWDPQISLYGLSGRYGPPLKMIEQFYTDNGVPLDEDREWDYRGRYELAVAEHSDRYNIMEGYTTAKLHFKRENRFYASIGFDGGVWYGQGRFNDNDPFYLMGKMGQSAGVIDREFHSPTGYWPKKMVHPENEVRNTGYVQVWYPWPIIRLADLYLLYAEAANEYGGPSDEVYQYINLVRERAGLPTVQDSWSNYSTSPDKYLSKAGLRSIIHQERTIEMMFEGYRHSDLRRWKRAVAELNGNFISGWNIRQSEAPAYYKPRVIFVQEFTPKEYLWPLSEHSILVNPNLDQNPGW